MIAFAAAPILVWKTGDLIQGEGPGTVAIVWPAGSDTVLSVQPDGTYQTRPKSAVGAWESATKHADKLVYRGTGIAWVVPIVEDV